MLLESLAQLCGGACLTDPSPLLTGFQPDGQDRALIFPLSPHLPPSMWLLPSSMVTVDEGFGIFW